jgi:peptidoglycan/LPS O-acetylase OafA/YrhL
MRAIAALLVVFHHAAWKARQHSTDPWSAFRIGECGVDLFFIISGFIMCEATSRRPIRFGAFMAARARRILPLYWLLTTMAWLVHAIAPGIVNSGGDTSVLSSYLLLPSTERYLIQNGWTLSYEFLFYAIFGLGLAWPSWARHALPAMILVALGTAGYFWTSAPLLVRFLTHPSLLEFAMGIAAFHLLRGRRISHAASLGLLVLGTLGLLAVNHLEFLEHRALVFGLPCWAIFVGIRPTRSTSPTSSCWEAACTRSVSRHYRSTARCMQEPSCWPRCGAA